MILTALVGLIHSLLYDVVLYHFGKMLSKTKQLRTFLGLNTLDENEEEFNFTTLCLEKIGYLLTVIAIVSAVQSVFTTLTVLSRL